MTSVTCNQQHQETMEFEVAPSTIPFSRHKHSACKKTYMECFDITSLVSTTDDPYAASESCKRRRLSPMKLEMEVFEQPRPSGLIFVGPDQSPTSEAYITGEKSTIGKSSYPSLLLTPYRGPARIVWYLVADSGMHPHPYSLEGQDCEGGVCVKKVQVDGQAISFPGLYVRRVRRREVKKSLEKRVDLLKMHLPGKEFKIKDSMEYNLGSVRICFQVKLIGGEQTNETSMWVLTRSLHSNEPSLQREPCIQSLSQCKGSVRGHEELNLQVTNLQTEDVMVYFHCESLVPLTSWQAFAEVISVSRKSSGLASVVIKTPAYHDQRISKPQTVSVQIRLMNNSISNTVKYTYTPLTKGVSGIEQRVKMKEPIFIQHFTCLGGAIPVPLVLGVPKGPDMNGTGLCKGTSKHFIQTVHFRDEVKRYKPVRVAKPQKVHASSQTNERHLLSEDEQLGYDSEEELGSGAIAVDYSYDRLLRYRSLMVDGAACTWMDFSPRAILGHSLQGSSSDASSLAPVLRESNSSCSIKSNSELGGLLRSLSLQEDEVRSSLADSSENSKADEFGSRKDTPKSSIDGVDEDSVQEEENTTLKVEPVDALLTHQHPAANSSLPEFSEDEVVPETQGASFLPDFSESKLLPARLKPLDKIVAIKKIAKIRYQEEAYSLWHSLEHRNLVPLIGVMKDKKSVSLVLEFPAGSVSSEMSSFPVDMQVNRILQVAKGLSYLHQNGLTHQEVRPQNFLISKTGDVMLSIPSNLTMARSHAEGQISETASLPSDRFEKLKRSDVYSFGVVLWELVNRQNKALTRSHTAFHKSPEDQMLFGLVSLAHECQDLDESHRPDIFEIVRKLQTLNQHKPQAAGASVIPSVIVESATPETTPSLADQSESGLNSPDSGVHCAPRFRNASQSSENLGTVYEQEDSLGSRECSFSDCSQRSKSSAEEVESGNADPSSNFSSGVQAANPQSSEGVTITNTESKPQDAQDPSGNRQDDNEEAVSVGAAAGDGHEHPGGQGGDQGQRGNPDRDLGSRLCPPRVTKLIDHTGGYLQLLNGDISLEIPPRALSEGQAEEITLTIDWNDQHIPTLKPTEMNAAPIVHCGPTGLKFNVPVLLRIPHCAVICEPKKIKMTIHCSHTDEGEEPRWERTSQSDNPKMQVEYQDHFFLLRTSNFCAFTVSLENGDESLAKEIMLVVYGNEAKTTEEDRDVRVYMYDEHAANREKIHQDEVLIGGALLYPPTSYHFLELNRGNMVVEVVFFDLSWKLESSARTKTFLWRKIWNLQSREQCKFTWNNLGKLAKFRCHIEVQQTDNDEKLLLEISNHAKVPDHDEGLLQTEQRLPAGECMEIFGLEVVREVMLKGAGGSSIISAYSRCDSGIYQPELNSNCLPPPPLIPYDLQIKLSLTLDIQDVLGNDWRYFASFLGFDDMIRILSDKQKLNPNFSPSMVIFERIERENRFNSLSDLKECFESIGRADLAKFVEEYVAPSRQIGSRSLAIEEAAPEENMQVTPSPDDVKNPLNALSACLDSSENLPLRGANGSPEGTNSFDQAGSRDVVTPVGAETNPDINRTPWTPESQFPRSQTDMNENIQDLESGINRMLKF